ncbi:hypothetical protein DFA_09039 [Cavenderia fasciculata]|uniref:Uncharacterized protein n=1 Tax=Cavenderia fasciculata TaxID=261658 RepID=F4Q6J1_CACFS|nr:uncharacterized protein DFA_09039 [Cavenderia fasciculata]EGG16501.1 hypothetical protein DFA_09039 [Cavenderia fasciculata]|eukprot:XP_004354901.1 hypothetical protein DFA_09039 [Cavenderia fasciculata]
MAQPHIKNDWFNVLLENSFQHSSLPIRYLPYNLVEAREREKMILLEEINDDDCGLRHCDCYLEDRMQLPFIIQSKIIYLSCSRKHQQHHLKITDLFKIAGVSKKWRETVKRNMSASYPLLFNPLVHCISEFKQHSSNLLCLFGNPQKISLDNSKDRDYDRFKSRMQFKRNLNFIGSQEQTQWFINTFLQEIHTIENIAIYKHSICFLNQVFKCQLPSLKLLDFQSAEKSYYLMNHLLINKDHSHSINHTVVSNIESMTISLCHLDWCRNLNHFQNLKSLDCTINEEFIGTMSTNIPQSVTNLSISVIPSSTIESPTIRIPPNFLPKSLHCLKLGCHSKSFEIDHLLDCISKLGNTFEKLDYRIDIDHLSLPYLKDTRMKDIQIKVSNNVERYLIKEAILSSTIQRLDIEMENISDSSFGILTALLLDSELDNLEYLKIRSSMNDNDDLDQVSADDKLITNFIVLVITQLKSLKEFSTTIIPSNFANNQVEMKEWSNQIINSLQQSKSIKFISLNNFFQDNNNNNSMSIPKSLYSLPFMGEILLPFIIQSNIIYLSCTSRIRYQHKNVNTKIKELFGIAGVSKQWRELVKRWVKDVIPLTFSPMLHEIEEYLQHTAHPLCLFGSTQKIDLLGSPNRLEKFVQLMTKDQTQDDGGSVSDFLDGISSIDLRYLNTKSKDSKPFIHLLFQYPLPNLKSLKMPEINTFEQDKILFYSGGLVDPLVQLESLTITIDDSDDIDWCLVLKEFKCLTKLEITLNKTYLSLETIFSSVPPTVTDFCLRTLIQINNQSISLGFLPPSIQTLKLPRLIFQHHIQDLLNYTLSSNIGKLEYQIDINSQSLSVLSQTKMKSIKIKLFQDTHCQPTQAILSSSIEKIHIECDLGEKSLSILQTMLTNLPNLKELVLQISKTDQTLEILFGLLTQLINRSKHVKRVKIISTPYLTFPQGNHIVTTYNQLLDALVQSQSIYEFKYFHQSSKSTTSTSSFNFYTPIKLPLVATDNRYELQIYNTNNLNIDIINIKKI